MKLSKISQPETDSLSGKIQPKQLKFELSFINNIKQHLMINKTAISELGNLPVSVTFSSAQTD